MKVHSTNYRDTFITVAEDCPAVSGEVPPRKGDEKSVANIQFEMVSQNPYQFNSDDIVFQCFAVKKGLAIAQLQAERELFFSKGQPCLRCSPLTKRYGWGVHCNKDGKIALYGVETEEYKKYSAEDKLKVIKAMRSKKA